jgi:hypothetical protein
VPRPLLAAAPLAAAALAVDAVGATGVVPGAGLFVIAGALAALATLRWLLAVRCRRTLRRTADELLRSGVSVNRESNLLRWRAAEHTSDRNRKMLSGSLNGIVREVGRLPHLSPVPLDRPRVRPHVALVAALASRVGELERPVSARGMVFVEDLLTDGYASPLYIGGRCGDVRLELARCLEALDDARGGSGIVVDLADRFWSGRHANFGRARVHPGGH